MATYDEMSKLLNPDEMSALWTYHYEAELKHAGNGDYDDAKYHKERKTLFYRQPITPP